MREVVCGQVPQNAVPFGRMHPPLLPPAPPATPRAATQRTHARRDQPSSRATSSAFLPLSDSSRSWQSALSSVTFMAESCSSLSGAASGAGAALAAGAVARTSAAMGVAAAAKAVVCAGAVLSQAADASD